VRPKAIRPALAADKGRGTVILQKTALLRPAVVEPARRVEKLVIGGGETRFKR